MNDDCKNAGGSVESGTETDAYRDIGVRVESGTETDAYRDIGVLQDSQWRICGFYLSKRSIDEMA